MAESAASGLPATVMSSASCLFKEKKQIATPCGAQPRKPPVTPWIDAPPGSPEGGGQSLKNATHPEMRCTCRAEFSKQAPVMRCLRSRQEHLALAPEARRVAPP